MSTCLTYEMPKQPLKHLCICLWLLHEQPVLLVTGVPGSSVLGLQGLPNTRIYCPAQILKTLDWIAVLAFLVLQLANGEEIFRLP